MHGTIEILLALCPLALTHLTAGGETLLGSVRDDRIDQSVRPPRGGGRPRNTRHHVALRLGLMPNRNAKLKRSVR